MPDVSLLTDLVLRKHSVPDMSECCRRCQPYAE